MALRSVGTAVLPPHRGPGGFDHASVYRGADRLYVAHTANDSVEVIDLGSRIHEATLDGFPGVAGAAVCEQRGLLAATCRSEGTVALTPLDEPARVKRINVGARPNGLALASGAGLALAACIGGDSTGPSLAIIGLEGGEVLASAPLPGRPRWTVYDEGAGSFYVNIAAPPEILVVSAAPPFEIVRSIAIPAPGPHGLDLDQRRGLLHCACDAGSVVTVDAASGRVVAQVTIAGGPDVVFFNPRRDHLYVAIGDPGVLQSIDTGAGRVVETIATEKGAHTFGFDAKREHIYALLPGAHAAAIVAEA
jgi:DNA-binding beta-propeller fold protein YncE